MAELFFSSFKRKITIIYIAHFILGIIVISININYHKTKYWINVSFKTLFLIGIIILCFFTIFPLIPLFYIYFHQNITKTFYNNNIKITLAFLIINILIGIILNIIFWINLSKFPSFYKDCPYNYSLSDLNKLNENYKSNEICQKRICLFYESKYLKNNYISLNLYNFDNSLNLEEDNPHNYLCNYESSKDFENNEVFCQKAGLNSKNDYLNYCNKYIFYYICIRNNDPVKYDININKGCPPEKNNSLGYGIGDILIILNIIFGCIPWILELFFIKQYLNKKVNQESEGQNENENQNNNQIIVNNGDNQNQNQNQNIDENRFRNLLNRTTHSSEVNLRRPTSNENININEVINETNDDKIKNKNSNESIKYIFVGKESKKNINNNNNKEDEKEEKKKEKMIIKLNRHYKYDYKLNINLIDSPRNDIETNNIETNNMETNNIDTNNIDMDANNNKTLTLIKESDSKIKKMNYGNLFNLKKNKGVDKNDFLSKHKRFINADNKTLSVIGTHFNIILNKKRDSSYNFKDLNKSNCDSNKKINNNVLDMIEPNCFTGKKEENKNKEQVNNLTNTVKRKKKEKNRIMDNIWNLIDSKSNLNNNLKKKEQDRIVNSQ